MTSGADDAQSPRGKRLGVVLGGGAAGIAIGLAAVYGIAGLAGNPATAACQPALETAQRIDPLVHGEVAALVPATRPLALPDLRFLDGAGETRSLADWRGRTVLLNLWATWCAPCREEMPALDELQRKLGGPNFEVVALNIDTRDPRRPKTWLQEVGIERLAYYADPTARVFQELRAVGRGMGLPTSILIDSAGCEVAHLAGPAEWASEDAVKLIEAALRP
jgi:thiol-disulfide isomerase/thioredoxin